MDAIVRVERLTKSYGKARGVEDLSFEVREGEVFGFLGPNGAGKTTTLRVLLDLLRPTSGTVWLFGLDPRSDGPALRRRIGYLSGESGLADRLTARDQLTYFANLRGGVPQARIDALANRFRLDLARPVSQMSRGNKQKVGIVQAFMHEPDLLVLDEPTSGLDPLMQQEFNALVRETRARGATVLLSSHILPEVETLCDRVVIVREGRMVETADVRTLKERAVRHGSVRFRGAGRVEVLAGVPGVSEVKAEGDELRFVVRGPTGPLVKALAGLDVVDLHLREPTLEDAFLGFYGGERP